MRLLYSNLIRVITALIFLSSISLEIYIVLINPSKDLKCLISALVTVPIAVFSLFLFNFDDRDIIIKWIIARFGLKVIRVVVKPEKKFIFSTKILIIHKDHIASSDDLKLLNYELHNTPRDEYHYSIKVTLNEIFGTEIITPYVVYALFNHSRIKKLGLMTDDEIAHHLRRKFSSNCTGPSNYETIG